MIKNTKISSFETFDSDPVNISLSRWIRSTMNSDCSFAKQVQQYRRTGKDSLKKSLPLSTVGAICEGGRKRSDVVERTGWIALDVDAKENSHIKDAGRLRDKIGQIVYVAFAGLSVSGRGVWALVKVEDPQQQDRHFEQLQEDFLNRGIVLDSTKGKNPNDARFYSFDPNAYIANQVKIYDRLPKPKPQPKPTQFKTTNTGYNTRAKVEQLISKINTDITGGYQNWLSLGFAIEDEFGESGRDYFHAISSYHSGYSRRETDKQYTHCLKHRGSGVGIGTFFHRCREYGFQLDYNHAPQRDNGSQAKYETKKLKKYPESWDNIKEPKNGTIEHQEATLHMMNDANETELQELMRRDPVVASLVEIFDAEPTEEIILNNH
jgi:hypothetical protein